MTASAFLLLIALDRIDRFRRASVRAGARIWCRIIPKRDTPARTTASGSTTSTLKHSRNTPLAVAGAGVDVETR